MRYAVLFTKTDTGYSAHVPDLPGCVAAGATLEETAELMRKALQMHLDGLREDGEAIPEPSTIAESHHGRIVPFGACSPALNPLLASQASS